MNNEKQISNDFLEFIKDSTPDRAYKELDDWTISMGFDNLEQYLETLRLDFQKYYLKATKKHGRSVLTPTEISKAYNRSKVLNFTENLLESYSTEQHLNWLKMMAKFQQLNLSYIDENKHQTALEKWQQLATIYENHKNQWTHANMTLREVKTTPIGNVVTRTKKLLDKYYQMIDLNSHFNYNPFDNNEKFFSLLLELEKQGFISDVSEFIQDIKKSLKLSEINKMKWRKNSTDLLGLFYFMYRGESYNKEDIFHIIPKLFVSINNIEYMPENLRKSIAPHRRYLMNPDGHFPAPKNFIKIQNILIDLKML